jgi:hypothetical protein
MSEEDKLLFAIEPNSPRGGPCAQLPADDRVPLTLYHRGSALAGRLVQNRALDHRRYFASVSKLRRRKTAFPVTPVSQPLSETGRSSSPFAPLHSL